MTDQQDLLDPATTPDKPRHGVRRLNNVPFVLLMAGGLLFVGGVGYALIAKSADLAGRKEERVARPALAAADELLNEGGLVGGKEGAASSKASMTIADQLIAAANSTPPIEDPTKPPSPGSQLEVEELLSGNEEAPAEPGPDPSTETEGSLPMADSELQAGQEASWAANSGQAPNAAEDESAQLRKEYERRRLELLQRAAMAPTRVQLDEAQRPEDRGDVASRIQHVQRQIAALDERQAAAVQGDFAAKLDKLREAGMLPEDKQATVKQAMAEQRDPYAAYAGKEGEDRWATAERVKKPESPYMVQVGEVIPGILETAINSDLAGPIKARVARDVYDSPSQQHLLIPQGSVLVGEYNSGVVYGQERVLIAWQLLRFPNGDQLDIGAMPGVDGKGRAGFEDQVNNHYWRIFGGAILMSLVGAGVGMTQPEATGAGPSFSGTLAQQLGQQIGQVSSELIQRNMNVAPTIEIREGYRFNVFVKKNLVLEGPYKE